MSRVVVVGGGLGGLASAALLGRAGHEVTLLEANPWLGGKSRRIELDGRRMDTGPSLLTFPGVWEEFLRRWDARQEPGVASDIAGLRLKRLPEVGRYYYRGEETSLPVEEGHPWQWAWERFVGIHGRLGPEVTRLLTADPADRGTLPALARLLKVYGAKLTTRSYLDGLSWLPGGLREIIAIHTLNAGVAPDRTPALYASMPAIMASDGVFVPEGGVYEVVLSLEKLARRAGVEIRTGEPVRKIRPGKVTTAEGEYTADAVVSDLDAARLERLLGLEKVRSKVTLSCSGVAVYAALGQELPAGVAAHSVVLPSDPGALYRSLEAGEEPRETMAFVNYYRGGEIYPNDGGTLAVLLTAPANGREYGLRRSVRRRGDRTRLRRGRATWSGHQVFWGVRDPGPRVLRRLGGRGRGALRGRSSVLEERAVAQAPLQRPQESVAVAGWGVCASRGRHTRRSRGGHDLHGQNATLSG